MSDSDRSDQVGQNGEAGAEGAGAEGAGAEGTKQKVDRRTFATEAEARQAGPVGKNQRLFRVNTPEPVYCWAGWVPHAFHTVALARGWTGGAVKAEDRDKAAALLARLSDEDRALLIMQYVPAPAPEPAKEAATKEPAPAKGRGKGKGN
jgi:hypothetical protein